MRKLLAISQGQFSMAALAGYNPSNPNGQATMANSQPVVIASNQAAIPVTGSFSFSLPTGASTSALQTTGNTALSSILSAVTGTLTTSGLTDAQLRATPIAVTLTGGGDATAANQITGNNTLSTINGKITAVNTGAVTVISAPTTAVTGTFWQATQPVSNTNDGTKITAATIPAGGSGFIGWLSAIWYQLTQTITTTVSGTVAVTGTFWQATQPISAASLPLPSSAATDTLQTTGNSSLSSIDGKITAVNTGAVVVSSSALPALAATSTKQSDGTQKTQIVDGSGNVIGATSNALDINIKSGNPTSITANAGTNLNTSALALDATVAALDVAQGSTTSGQQGLLMQGAVTTSAPTYTTAQTSPISLDTQGNARVLEYDQYIAGQGSQTALNNNILLATAGTSSVDALGYHSASVQIVTPAGTYTTGAIIFEGSNDNTNFVTIPVFNQAILTGTTITAAITLATATSLTYTFPVQTRYIRCRISTGVTGASASVQAFTKLSPKDWTPVTNQIGNNTAANTLVTATLAASSGVRVTGNAGGIVDAANNATAPANVWMAGIQLRDATTATAGTVGQVGNMAGSLDHVLYTRSGGPVTFSCGLDNIAATLTQCQGVAGAGLAYYITGWIAQSTTATAGLMTLETGTGTNCGTGTAALLAGTATARFAAPANTSPPAVVTLPVPLRVTTASAICVLGVATNTTSIQIFGYTAP